MQAMKQSAKRESGRSEALPDSVVLGWMGCEMRLPPNMRLLSQSGNYRKGDIVFAGGDDTFASIRWQTRGARHLLKERPLKRTALRAAKRLGLSVTAADLNRIEKSAGISGYEINTDCSRLRVGYSSVTRRALILFTQKTPRDCMETFCETPLGEWQKWSVFGVKFQTPPGFRVFRSELKLGSIMLDLQSKQGALTLRILYPGTLAVERMALMGWVEQGLKDFKGIYNTRTQRFKVDPDRVEGYCRPSVFTLFLLPWKSRAMNAGACFERDANRLTIWYYRARSRVVRRWDYRCLSGLRESEKFNTSHA